MNFLLNGKCLPRYDIYWNKGYQVFDVVTSTVTTKVKGLGYVKFDSNGYNQINDHSFIDFTDYKGFNNINNHAKFGQINGYRVFDTADYVIPPKYV